jgi:hypothetical protein
MDQVENYPGPMLFCLWGFLWGFVCLFVCFLIYPYVHSLGHFSPKALSSLLTHAKLFFFFKEFHIIEEGEVCKSPLKDCTINHQSLILQNTKLRMLFS